MRSTIEPATGRAADISVRKDLPWMLALFGATLWNICHTMGTSPTVWIDTLIEELFIDACLTGDRCTIVGPGATIGIFHSAGYLHWRALLTWLGLNPNGVFLVLLAMNAFGVTLVALAARRLGGRVAAALAAMLIVPLMGVPMQLNVITDVAPVPFLGAVFLLVAVATVQRPSFAMTTALGMVGGVMANVYATEVLCGVSAVWIALLLPQRRWAHAFVAAAAFALTTFALAPSTWIVNAGIVLAHGAGNAHTSGPSRALDDIPVARLTAMAAAAWTLAMFVSRKLRRRLDVPAAILLPLFAPLALGYWAGVLDPQDKYCAHVIGAVAATLGLFVAGAGRGLWQVLKRFLPQPTQAAAIASLGRLAPYLAALLILRGSVSTGTISSMTDFNYQDFVTVQRVLSSEHGWAWTRVWRNLRPLDDNVRRALLRWVPGWPETGTEGDLERAYLLKVRHQSLPKSLPPNIQVIGTTDTQTTLLALTCSWIDWHSFQVCMTDPEHPEETCQPCALTPVRDANADFGLPCMPTVNAKDMARQTMTLRVPLTPNAQCPEQWIYLPPMPRICRGRALSVDGETTAIEDSGHWVKLKQNGDATPHELVLQWQLGWPDCWVQYGGYPPFMVEGDPTSATVLAEILHKEDHPEGAPPPPRK